MPTGRWSCARIHCWSCCRASTCIAARSVSRSSSPPARWTRAGHLGLEQRDYPQAAYLLGAAQAARAVSVKPLVEKGLKGAELGEALKRARLAALKAYKEERGKA